MEINEVEVGGTMLVKSCSYCYCDVFKLHWLLKAGVYLYMEMHSVIIYVWIPNLSYVIQQIV